MGSSPIVSTTNCLVTALLFVRDLCWIARRAHCVPTNDGLWRVVVGTGGHGRLLAEALEQLRNGKVADAIDWYRQNNRIVTAPTRDEALDAAVAAWETDLRSGHATVLLAWRRRDVAALNERARQRRIEAGAIFGPEIEAPGGKRYAGGDRVVTLAPAEDGRFVTSERGTVTLADVDRLSVRFDDGRTEALTADEFANDRLDHSYAVTVHRMQGATVDRAHIFVDGGGRELAYVAMSRARDNTHVYLAADGTDRAVEDLTAERSVDRRQRWTLDTDQPAGPGDRTRPDLARQTAHVIRIAQLRAERDAIAAVAPDATRRLEALDLSLRLHALEAEGPSRRQGLGLG